MPDLRKLKDFATRLQQAAQQDPQKYAPLLERTNALIERSVPQPNSRPDDMPQEDGGAHEPIRRTGVGRVMNLSQPQQQFNPDVLFNPQGEQSPAPQQQEQPQSQQLQLSDLFPNMAGETKQPKSLERTDPVEYLRQLQGNPGVTWSAPGDGKPLDYNPNSQANKDKFAPRDPNLPPQAPPMPVQGVDEKRTPEQSRALFDFSERVNSPSGVKPEAPAAPYEPPGMIGNMWDYFMKYKVKPAGRSIEKAADDAGRAFAEKFAPSPKQLGAGQVQGTGKYDDFLANPHGNKVTSSEMEHLPYSNPDETTAPQTEPTVDPEAFGGGGGMTEMNKLLGGKEQAGGELTKTTPEKAGWGLTDFLGLLLGGRNFLAHKSAENRADRAETQSKQQHDETMAYHREADKLRQEGYDKKLAVELELQKRKDEQNAESEVGKDQRNVIRGLMMPMANDKNPEVQAELNRIKALRAAREKGKTEIK